MEGDLGWVGWRLMIHGFAASNEFGQTGEVMVALFMKD